MAEKLFVDDWKVWFGGVDGDLGVDNVFARRCEAGERLADLGVERRGQLAKLQDLEVVVLVYFN